MQVQITAKKPERLLHRVTAAAHILDTSVSQIYNLVNRGELEVVRVGRSIRISAETLKRLADSAQPLGVE